MKKENPRVLKKRAEFENKEFLMKDGEWIKVMKYYTAHNCTIKYLSDDSIIENVQARTIEKRTIKKVINHVGEVWTMNDGNEIEIIMFDGWNNCTIRYSDGFVVENIKYGNIKQKSVKRFVDKVGEVHINNQGLPMTIVASNSYSDCDVQFEDGHIIKGRSYNNIESGSVVNPYHPTICNFGYDGVGRHPTKDGNGNITPMYNAWRDMIRRCYDATHLIKYPSYRGCSVDNRWACFQIFGDWYEEHYKKGFALDKDIKFKGNKRYSPETCEMLPREINGLIVHSKDCRGDYPIGVHYDKNRNLFVAQISINGRQIPLGCFDTEEEAFEAYKIAKEAHIKVIADKWENRIPKSIYNSLYNWTIEITD